MAAAAWVVDALGVAGMAAAERAVEMREEIVDMAVMAEAATVAAALADNVAKGNVVEDALAAKRAVVAEEKRGVGRTVRGRKVGAQVAAVATVRVGLVVVAGAVRAKGLAAGRAAVVMMVAVLRVVVVGLVVAALVTETRAVA